MGSSLFWLVADAVQNRSTLARQQHTSSCLARKHQLAGSTLSRKALGARCPVVLRSPFAQLT